MSFLISNEKGTLHFRGAIDDHAHIGAISSMGDHVTINLRGVTSINSIGARKFLDFVSTWKGLKVTFEECPYVLVDAFLMLPSLLGPQENTARLSSFQVAYDCPRCKQQHDLFIKADDLQMRGTELVFPTRVCPSCAGHLTVDQNSSQLADFIELGALKLA